MLPASLVGAAIINGCRLSLDSNPEMAWRALSNLWTVIAPALLPALSEKPQSELACAAVVIEAYFGCDGDWKRMERILSTSAMAQTLMPEALLNAFVSKLGKSFFEFGEKLSREEKAK